MAMHIDTVEAEVEVTPTEPTGTGASSDASAELKEIERLRRIVMQILEEEIERIQRR